MGHWNKIIRLLVIFWAGFLSTGCGLIDTIKARQAAHEGTALYRESDYRGAIEKFETAIELDPETPNIYLNLGYSYFSIYDPTAESEQSKNAAAFATAAFAEHLKRYPEDENARVFQIKILLSAAPNDKALADQAHKIFLEMLAKNPDDHEARQYLITLFIDGRRYEDAVVFFNKDLEKKPDDIVTMKILAIIADKSNNVQAAVDWYWRRAEVTPDDEKKAVLLYEVGTYAWNLLHYQHDKVKGVEAVKLADQGIDCCLKAMQLKAQYAEAMIYGNLLYLKRALYETEEVARTWDSELAFALRVEAGKILMERKKKKAIEETKDKNKDVKQEEKESADEKKVDHDPEKTEGKG
ncbi:MAG: tetratricopeptide repeat protein [Deltaproteobacteria bacterium]|nr:tetratricopeptide repeat protein [Deltaproteobacteria bacterium]